MVTSSRRDQHEPMPFDVHRMLRLWTDPLPEDDEAAELEAAEETEVEDSTEEPAKA